MKTPLLFKIAFWLMIIGVAALTTPNPAWPEWVARMLLSTGIALGVTTFGVALVRRKKNHSDKDQ